MNLHSLRPRCLVAATLLYCIGYSEIVFSGVLFPRGKMAGSGEKTICAINRGTLDCWGNNTHGQADVPSDLVNPRWVAVSGLSTCALDDRGVHCWGGYERNGSGITRVPPDIQGQEIEELAVGNFHACVILAGNRVRCWGGWNRNLSFNEVNRTTFPNPRSLVGSEDQFCFITDEGVVCGTNSITLLEDFDNPRELSASPGMGLCALVSNGVDCRYGGRSHLISINPDLRPRQLTGDLDNFCVLTDEGVICGSWDHHLEPFRGLLNPTELYAIGGHRCATHDGGNGIKCRGRRPHYRQPVFNNRITSAREVVVGLDHSCALGSGGVTCWGSNLVGQISVPPDLLNPRGLAAGKSHTCALTDEGVRCWGSSLESPHVPDGLSNPSKVVAGGYATCAFDDVGLQCWRRRRGGDGYTHYQVRRFDDDGNEITEFAEVAIGDEHMCLISDEARRVFCYGSNSLSQTDVPDGLVNPRGIVAGSFYTCVITDEGVKCWGNSPAVPGDLVNPRRLFAGGGGLYWTRGMTCAITDDGIQCWGDIRQRRDRHHGGLLQFDEPVSDLSQLSISNFHYCYITDGQVKCRGDSELGEAHVPGLELPISRDVNLMEGFRAASQALYAEKRDFLESILRSLDDDDEVVRTGLLYFCLRPFLESLESSRILSHISIDIPDVDSFFLRTQGRSSLSDFGREEDSLRFGLNVMAHSLISTKRFLNVDAREEVDRVLLPLIADKVALTSLDGHDGVEVARAFATNRIALQEISDHSRTRPFGVLMQELVSWMEEG